MVLETLEDTEVLEREVSVDASELDRSVRADGNGLSDGKGQEFG